MAISIDDFVGDRDNQGRIRWVLERGILISICIDLKTEWCLIWGKSDRERPIASRFRFEAIRDGWTRSHAQLDDRINLTWGEVRRRGGETGTRDRSSDRKLRVDPRCIRCCNWTPRTPLNQLSPAKRSHYLRMRKHEKVDKRCARVGGDIAAQLTSYSPSGAYDIRLDFGKLSPRITRARMRGPRRCLLRASARNFVRLLRRMQVENAAGRIVGTYDIWMAWYEKNYTISNYNACQ